jgi:hypothetical protein
MPHYFRLFQIHLSISERINVTHIGTVFKYLLS